MKIKTILLFLFAYQFVSGQNCEVFMQKFQKEYQRKERTISYGGFDKTAFVLRKDQYGRIVFNERNTYYDTGEWYYQFFVFNIVCCEKDNFKEKIFFNKNPDYEFNGMKYLRYC
jgi:hypothetical protein